MINMGGGGGGGGDGGWGGCGGVGGVGGGGGGGGVTSLGTNKLHIITENNVIEWHRFM